MKIGDRVQSKHTGQIGRIIRINDPVMTCEFEDSKDYIFVGWHSKQRYSKNFILSKENAIKL